MGSSTVTPAFHPKLLNMAAKGDSDAKAELARRLAKWLLPMLERRIPDRGAFGPQDIYQVTWLKVEMALHGFNPRSFKAWVWKIAMNTYRDALRWERRRGGGRQVAIDSGGDEGEGGSVIQIEAKQPRPEQSVEDRDSAEAIKWHLKELPHELWEVFVLSRLENLSERQTAAQLRLSPSMVHRRLVEADKWLRNKLGVGRRQ